MPSSPAHILRVNAVELLRQPGSRREIVATLPAVTVDVDDQRITDEIAIELSASSNVDGIVVHGTVSTPWAAVCRRCLTAVDGLAVAEIDEVYQIDVTDDEAYEIAGGQIDLVPAVREHVLLELPEAPLCRHDCAGICPVCGVDRNKGACHCDTTVRDERWAALDDIRLDDLDD